MAKWQHDYNWYRPRCAINGKTPVDRCRELTDKTPLSRDIEKFYQPEKEIIQNPNYKRV
ncbi:MAG: hypothetical protein OQK77_11375 [Psychromonas sp.]|nr:hypothetical protein [Psychromonas sp.]